MTFFNTGTPIDACWPYFIDRDACEVRENREEQKMILARYARQSIFDWGDVRVTEIRAWVARLHKLIQMESPSGRITEG